MVGWKPMKPMPLSTGAPTACKPCRGSRRTTTGCWCASSKQWRTGTNNHVDPYSCPAYKPAGWPPVRLQQRWQGQVSVFWGGLLGLGRAEFRLPLLVSALGYSRRRAMPLNRATSFVAVVVAACSRWLLAGQAPLASVAPVAIAMMFGGMIGALVGSHWLARVS